MKIWFRRILSLAFISLGFALTFLPFNDTRSGSVEQEVVYLQKENLLDPEIISSRYPGEEIIEVSDPEFNPDDYPELWRAFNNLDAEWVSDTCNFNEWNRFQESVLQEKKEFRLLVFHESLIDCSVKTNKRNSELASFSYLGRYNTNIKELLSSDLNKYPTIVEAIENINFGKESFSKLSPIPMVEWNKMVDRYLNPMEDLQTFKFSGIFYGPEFAWDTVYKDGSIEGFKTILKVVGIFLVVIGFLLIYRLYFQKQGIMVNPRGVALLYDFISLLFAVPSAYMLANVVLSKTLFITPITNEEFILFMGTFFFCISIPFLTWYTSRFTSQSILINSEGIFVDSLIRKDFIAWDKIDSLEFSDEFVFVSRIGIPMPRQLQKSLAIIGKEEQHIVINEPQLKSVKKKILTKFKTFVPEHFIERILPKLENW